MTSLKLSEIPGVLDRYDVFCVFGHLEPDADCLGSQRALGSWLERRDKKVHLCSAGPWDRPEIAAWQAYFGSRIPRIAEDESVLNVILDCSSPERTGFKESGIFSYPTLVIDHHATGDDYGEYRYIESESPSTSLLIQRLIELSGDSLTLEESKLLLLGFCTDTGFFRHLGPNNAKHLEAVSRLVKIGASPSEIFRQLSGGKEIGSRKLLGRALNRAEAHFGGRVIMTWDNWKDWRECGSDRDADLLYQILMGIVDVEIAIVIREQNDGFCKIGLRSNSDFDVSEIAGYFGGGGHRKASGCFISGDRHDAMEHLLKIVADRLKIKN